MSAKNVSFIFGRLPLDGNNPRIDRALISMLKTFQAMFTNAIWKHIGIVFTKLTMDPKMKARREKNNHLTDQEKGNAYLKEVVRLFPECRAENLVFFHLDAQYDKDDEGEAGTFKIEAESLWSLFKEKPELSTDQVAKVKTENEEIKSRIEQEVAMKVARTVDNAKQEGTAELEEVEGTNRTFQSTEEEKKAEYSLELMDKQYTESEKDELREGVKKFVRRHVPYKGRGARPHIRYTNNTFFLLLSTKRLKEGSKGRGHLPYHIFIFYIFFKGDEKHVKKSRENRCSCLG